MHLLCIFFRNLVFVAKVVHIIIKLYRAEDIVSWPKSFKEEILVSTDTEKISFYVVITGNTGWCIHNWSQIRVALLYPTLLSYDKTSSVSSFK